MFDIAEQVARWQADGAPVTVARVVEVRGISSRDRAAVVATTPDAPMVGSVLSGAVDGALAALLAEDGPSRRVEVTVDDPSAHRVGLSCGGSARLLVGPAAELPADLWTRLAAREPVCLVARLDGDVVVGTDLLTGAGMADADPRIAELFRAGVSSTVELEDRVVSALWPVPALVIVGTGAVADSLAAMAGLLGWTSSIVDDPEAAGARIANLGAADGVALLSHDLDVAGPALLAALAAGLGYVGAMGSRRTQDARATWLAARGVTDLSAVHGPAGLDIGADTPAEIALAIFAEMLAARSGGTAASLRDRGGPIHRR